MQIPLRNCIGLLVTATCHFCKNIRLRILLSSWLFVCRSSPDRAGSRRRKTQKVCQSNALLDIISISLILLIFSCTQFSPWHFPIAFYSPPCCHLLISPSTDVSLSPCSNPGLHSCFRFNLSSCPSISLPSSDDAPKSSSGLYPSHGNFPILWRCPNFNLSSAPFFFLFRQPYPFLTSLPLPLSEILAPHITTFLRRTIHFPMYQS